MIREVKFLKSVFKMKMDFKGQHNRTQRHLNLLPTSGDPARYLTQITRFLTLFQ